MATGFENRKLHLVGIGGAGMSGLALTAHQLGAEVSGSDREESTYTERLKAEGVAVTIGHDAANVPEGADVVRSTAIADDNPEIVEAEQRKLRLMHRSELLTELVETKPASIAVAGTHGKTTTTAMISHVLDALGLDPSFFVGGEVTIGERTTNAHIGAGDVAVLEADESDGSFTRYRPTVAIVTNIEFEHPETWSGLDELMLAFKDFLGPAESVVIGADQPRAEELEIGERATTFAIAPQSADLVAADVQTPADPSSGSRFRLGDLEVELGVRGEHNVKNALAALAALSLVGVEPERAASELKGFRGVARRFELLGEHPSGAVIYDDYAHHPTEVRAALTTARQTVGDGRVVAVYQPHLFSRTIAYQRDFGEALDLADVVVVLDIYPSREKAENFPGVTGWLAATATSDAAPGKTVHYAPTFDDAEHLLKRILKPGDLCMTIGAGTVSKLGHKLAGDQR